MELLIPGLILVALMVYASTRIKKRAAEAFDAERIETETYTLNKPDGFLHVIDDPDHEFRAYSKDFGTGDEHGIRQATIELDILRDAKLDDAVDAIRNASESFEVTSRTGSSRTISTVEQANDIESNVVYKLIESGDSVFRLRFAVLSEHYEGYLRKIDEALNSFDVRP